MIAIIAALAVSAPALSFTNQQLAVDGRILWCDGRDLDGDGRADLVVVFRRGEEPNTRRFIAVYIQNTAGTYPEKANAEIALPKDAVFAQIEDLFGEGKASILLVTGKGASALRYANGALVLSELVQAPTPSLFPEIEDLPVWHFASDWHKHGMELALFHAGNVTFYHREGGKFAAGETIALEPVTYVDAMGGAFLGAWSNRNFSISVADVFPELVVGEYDGDGKPDLFAIQDDRLQVFLGEEGGHFSHDAKVALDFHMRTTEEHQRRNAFVAATVVDLNGDGKLDYVANKVSGGLQSMKSETRVHLNKGGFHKTADQVMKRDGFSAMVQFVDLDKDGRPEMIEPTAEIGLFALARAMVSKKLSVDWLVTPNKDGHFAPNEARRIPIVFGLDFSGGPIFRGPFPRFKTDFNGDGIPDFMSSADGSELSFYLGGNGSFEAEPSVKVPLEVSPYTTSFVDPRTHRAQVLTFFRDMPGKEGKIVLLLNGTAE